MNSSKVFSDLIKSVSYKGKPYEEVIPLTNITFFLGAGFSKSWDLSYPTGTELFDIKYDECFEGFQEFIQNIRYNADDDINFSKFKDIFYHLTMMKKYPSLLGRYIDEFTINEVENAIRGTITAKFRDRTKLNFIQDYSQKLYLDKPTEDQQQILRFFHWLNGQITGDRDSIPEGLRTNFITTNYDFLIESIQDSIIGEDDSSLLYNYRGFTPLKVNQERKAKTVFNHWLVNTLIKINGGFEIFEDGESFSIDYTNKDNKLLNEKAPLLILPNREQDYTGKYFQTIFPKAIRTLQESQILVIIGYSLPEEDALLRLLLRQFAEENTDGKQKIIFYIDLMDEQNQKEKINELFPYMSSKSTPYNLVTYSGNFVEWIKGIDMS